MLILPQIQIIFKELIMKKLIFFISMTILCFYFVSISAGVGVLILAIISFIVSNDKNDKFQKPEL